MEVPLDRAIEVSAALIAVGSYWGIFRTWRRRVNVQLKRNRDRMRDLERAYAKQFERRYVPRYQDVEEPDDLDDEEP